MSDVPRNPSKKQLEKAFATIEKQDLNVSTIIIWGKNTLRDLKNWNKEIK